MTFLPLVERELRVRARRRSGYWSRFGVALGGLLVCLPLLLESGSFGPPGGYGKGIFDGLVIAAFMLSCSACLSTASGLRAEQKEGTLGLLFLTRVKALDVLLGKLGSAGFTSLCSLLAFVPVMMVPLLAGGVTGGEAARKGLALLATLCLALALGLWAATANRGLLRSPVGALLLLVLVPYLLWQFSSQGLKCLGVLSPLVAVVSAGDSSYRAAKGWYWATMGAVSLLSGMALLAAGFRLRRITTPEALAEPAHEVKFNLAGREVSSRVRWSREEDSNPVAWLVRRQAGVKARLLGAGMLSLLYHAGTQLLLPWLGRTAGRSLWVTMWVPGMAISLVVGALVAWCASRFFIEARRTAELEVLLSTPVGARKVVSGQWSALQRLLVWPVALMLLPLALRLVFMLKSLGRFPGTSPWPGFALQQFVSLGLSTVGVFLHVAALCWLGMWFGLKSRGQAGAVAWSTALATGVPYVASMGTNLFFVLVFSRFLGGPGTWYFTAISCGPQVFSIGLTLGLIGWARSRLRGELSGAAPGPFALRGSFSQTARDTASAFRKARHWTPT